ncbi:MAG: DUF2520 domain-containing protein [Zoogloeaceae bacterium]|nr:DUF2520 domain-containing protein [Zoogloeaceae bacterium]
MDQPDRFVLNIVGCGRAARTLARLWAGNGPCEIGDVLTRSPASAQDAVAFIGQGRAVAGFGDMRPAALWMLGVPDRDIAAAAAALAISGCVRPGDGVFHLSGFTPSAVLAPLEAIGARIASVHPVMSFADPALAAGRFAGTPCGIEGEATLAAELAALFAAIGAECFALDGSRKPLYHAGSVFASNFLVVILDVARKAYVDSGVPPDIADRMLAAIAGGALENVVALGARDALTGPAARGDREVVALQHAAVADWDAGSGLAYAALTELAFRLAAERPD